MIYTIEKSLRGKIIVQTVHESEALKAILANKHCVLYCKNKEETKVYPQISYKTLLSNQLFKQYLNLFDVLNRDLVIQDNLSVFKTAVIIGHGKEHASRVGFLATIICYEEQTDLEMAATVIFGALLHDVGRNYTNLSNDRHGEESVRLVKKALEKEQDNNRSELAVYFKNIGFLFCNQSKATQAALFGAISVHCKDNNAWAAMGKVLPIKVRSVFWKLANSIEDADALDRVRFSNNLDFNYLRLKVSKCLIYSAGQVLKNGVETEYDNKN